MFIIESSCESILKTKQKLEKLWTWVQYLSPFDSTGYCYCCCYYY